jgi:predicted secreted Zn-dependent protease
MKINWEKANWRKSTGSDTGACIEVAHAFGMVGVRDTKDFGRGPVLAFTEREWRAFIYGVDRHEFDYETLSKPE